jgi:hypothetical protein
MLDNAENGRNPRLAGAKGNVGSGRPMLCYQAALDERRAKGQCPGRNVGAASVLEALDEGANTEHALQPLANFEWTAADETVGYTTLVTDYLKNNLTAAERAVVGL